MTPGGGGGFVGTIDQDNRGRLALVFGREDHGLTVEELMACTQLCAIPTGRVQPSLNLSHSAGIALAHVRLPTPVAVFHSFTPACAPLWFDVAMTAGLTPLHLPPPQCFEKRLEHMGPLESSMPEPHPSHEPHAPPAGWPAATTEEVNYLMQQWAAAAEALGLPSQVLLSRAATHPHARLGLGCSLTHSFAPHLPVSRCKRAWILTGVAVRPQEYDGGKTHYRRRRVMGHLRALFSRASINTQEVKSLHGLVKRITAAANQGKTRQAKASGDEEKSSE
jgi:hypothetical protein